MSIVAVFTDRAQAHQAAKRLHADGFHNVWIGVTSAYVESDDTYSTGALATTIVGDDKATGAKAGRFFSDETDGATLTETLMQHGVSEAEAVRIDATIEPEAVLLTVDSDEHPERVGRIVDACSGSVLSGDPFVAEKLEWTGGDPPRESRILGDIDPTEFGVVVPTLREDIFISRFEDEVNSS
jgi:hypothetical protein